MTVRLRRRRPVCSRCGQTGAFLEIPDRRVKRWRHLDLGANRCVIECHLTGLRCPDCGVHLKAVPWARPEAQHHTRLRGCRGLAGEADGQVRDRGGRATAARGSFQRRKRDRPVGKAARGAPAGSVSWPAPGRSARRKAMAHESASGRAPARTRTTPSTECARPPCSRSSTQQPGPRGCTWGPAQVRREMCQS